MRHYADPMRHHPQIFLQRRFDLVGHPGDDPIPRQYRRPDTRAYELRQQPLAAPSIRASGFFFVTGQHTFPPALSNYAGLCRAGHTAGI